MKIEREFVSESGNIKVEVIKRYDGEWKVTWYNRDEMTFGTFADAEYVIKLILQLIDQGYKC